MLKHFFFTPIHFAFLSSLILHSLLLHVDIYCWRLTRLLRFLDTLFLAFNAISRETWHSPELLHFLQAFQSTFIYCPWASNSWHFLFMIAFILFSTHTSKSSFWHHLIANLMLYTLQENTFYLHLIGLKFHASFISIFHKIMFALRLYSCLRRM